MQYNTLLEKSVIKHCLPVFDVTLVSSISRFDKIDLHHCHCKVNMPVCPEKLRKPGDLLLLAVGHQYHRLHHQ